jgi:hypothetical protein
MSLKPKKVRIDTNADPWKAKRLDLCAEIDSAIQSINSCVAALERLNAERRQVHGSKSIPWNLENEALLEGIVEALAYPERRNSSIYALRYIVRRPYRP